MKTIPIEKEIQKLAQNIIKNFPTSKEIILFGSHADSSNDTKNDIDLCILTKSRKRKIDLLREVRKILSSVTSYPLDILIYKPDEFYKRASLTSTLEYNIKNKGIKLYG